MAGGSGGVDRGLAGGSGGVGRGLAGGSEGFWWDSEGVLVGLADGSGGGFILYSLFFQVYEARM